MSTSTPYLSRFRQQRLSHFVDRSTELKAFQSFLASRDKTLFWIWGCGGTGKSTLLTRCVEECLANQCRIAEVGGSTRQFEPVDFMVSIVKSIGPRFFLSFSNVLKDPGISNTVRVSIESSGDLQVASRAGISNSQIGSLSGISIEQMNVTLGPSDVRTFQVNQLIRLTDCFVSDLSGLPNDKDTVFFIDAAERLAQTSVDWIREEIVQNLVDRAPHIRVAVFSREKPVLDPSLAPFAEVRELQAVGLDVVREYLQKRRIKQEFLEGATLAIYAATRGNMLMVANDVDNLLELQQSPDQ
jgi:hypothetical protein